MENEEKARSREVRNRRDSIVYMIIFGIVLIAGVVLLIIGINKQIVSGSSDVHDMVNKVLFCVFGGTLTVIGGLCLISTAVVFVTKFEGKSRNPINNIIRDSVSEFQDMIDDTGDALAPKHRGKKICPDCGQENDKDETICTRCGGGLGE